MFSGHCLPVNMKSDWCRIRADRNSDAQLVFLNLITLVGKTFGFVTIDGSHGEIDFGVD